MNRKHEARLPEKNLIWKLFPVCAKPVTAGLAGYFSVLFSGLAEAFSGEPETRGPFTGKKPNLETVSGVRKPSNGGPFRVFSGLFQSQPRLNLLLRSVEKSVTLMLIDIEKGNFFEKTPCRAA
ncbi:TPA: hypothetical protein ACID6F_003714 [Pseudomonas aeruginosa]